MTRYSLLVYRSRNLGDILQTIAMSRLLPRARAVHRHRMAEADPQRTFVVNGFLHRDAPPGAGPDCLFAGISGPHVAEMQAAYLAWYRRSPYPIGVRDPATARLLETAGLPAELVGCSTLTLPSHEGTRYGVYSVDTEGPGRMLTHRIHETDDVRSQWRAGLDRLELYRRAEAVYTSRLHVALPCLAFGTPVWIRRPGEQTWKPERFSLLDVLGVPYEELTTRDVSAWSASLRRFLDRRLGGDVLEREPQMPVSGG